jgi:hypothetical protein
LEQEEVLVFHFRLLACFQAPSIPLLQTPSFPDLFLPEQVFLFALPAFPAPKCRNVLLRFR